MAVATGKPFEAKKPFKKGGDKQIAYLATAVNSLVKKEPKKAAKSKKHKRRSYDTPSSDSDSE
jgi:hypothetical protein